MADAVLTIGGKAWGGWQGVEIQRGLEQFAGVFTLRLSDRWPGQYASRPIAPGAACSVAIGAETVITGHVDELTESWDGQDHTIEVTGRDAAGDLVDCSIEALSEVENRTLKQLAESYCKPFGIKVSATAPAGAPFSTFKPSTSETVYEALERASRMRGVLIVSDGKGGIVLTRAASTPSGISITEEMVKAGSIQSGWKDRYSQYLVYGDRPGDDDSSGDDVTQGRGRARDKTVTRHRPLVILAEDIADWQGLKDRAAWERNVRAGRAEKLSLTVVGWLTPAGKVWAPNTLVGVSVPSRGISGTRLISEVTLTRDASGTVAVLTLVDRLAFARITVKEDEAFG